MNSVEFKTNLLRSIKECKDFHAVLTLLNSLYEFDSSSFENNGLKTQAFMQLGTLKIFSVALHLGFSKEETLEMFKELYTGTIDRSNPHQNVKNLMHGDMKHIKIHNKNVISLCLISHIKIAS